MKKALIPAALLAAGMAMPSFAAPATPQVTDPAGDWAVPHGDVVSARLSTLRTETRRASKPVLRVELTLVAPPAVNVPQAYHVEFSFDSCAKMLVSYYWSGGVAAFSDEAFVDASSCHDASQVAVVARLTDVPVRVVGRTVVWDVPLVYGMRVGTRLVAPTAKTSGSGVTRQLGGRYYVYVPGGDTTAPGTDYVIGR